MTLKSSVCRESPARPEGRAPASARGWRGGRARAGRDGFDEFIAIDWSGAGGAYRGIAVARCAPGEAAPRLVRPAGPRWTRTAVADWLGRELSAGRRLLVGFDFAFGLPFEPGSGYLAGRANRVGGIFALWDLIEAASRDEADFGCAAIVADARFSPLYWRAGKQPRSWVGRRRLAELACAAATSTRPETVFKLVGPKQVGKASLAGIRVLRHVRTAHPAHVAIWPFEAVGTKSALVEIYPTLFRKQAADGLAKLRTRAELNLALKRLGSRGLRADARAEPLTDHDTDALISAAGLRRLAAEPSRALAEIADPRIRREGWIFGVPLSQSRLICDTEAR